MASGGNYAGRAMEFSLSDAYRKEGGGREEGASLLISE